MKYSATILDSFFFFSSSFFYCCVIHLPIDTRTQRREEHPTTSAIPCDYFLWIRLFIRLFICIKKRKKESVFCYSFSFPSFPCAVLNDRFRIRSVLLLLLLLLLLLISCVWYPRIRCGALSSFLGAVVVIIRRDLTIPQPP